MAVKIQCPNPKCGEAGSVTAELLGQVVTCSFCGFDFTASAGAAPAKTQLAPRAAVTYLGKDLPAFAPAGAFPVAAPAAMPQRIGRFQVRAILGRGAFGVVYRAYDADLDREVALKVPHPHTLENPKAVARFLDEGKAAARLHHPHIVPVYEVCAIGGHYYLVSALIAGRTLAETLAAGPLPVAQVVQIIAALADALSHAHSLGIIHRDVKPANVLLDARGHPYLMDFGIARLPDFGRNLTKLGDVLGTPGYLSPEQAAGQPATAASDQYSLGVMLYELLCGQKPFAGPAQVVLYHTSKTVPPTPRSIHAAVPPQLEAICLKAMAKRPADRYASCGELAEDLRGYERGAGGLDRLGENLDVPSRHVPNRPSQRDKRGGVGLGKLRDWWRRHPVARGLAVAACSFTAALLILFLFVAALGRRPDPEPTAPEADAQQKQADAEKLQEEIRRKERQAKLEEEKGRANKAALLLAAARDDWQDGKFDRAKTNIDQAAVLKPGNPAVHEARQHLNRAREVYFVQLLQKAQSISQNGQFDDAKREIDQAEAMKPGDPAAEIARQELNRAKDSHLAQLLKKAHEDWQGGQFDEASEKITRGENLKPGDPTLVKARQELNGLWAKAKAQHEECEKVLAAYTAARKDAEGSLKTAQEKRSPKAYREAYVKFKGAKELLSDARAALSVEGPGVAAAKKKLEGALVEARKNADGFSRMEIARVKYAVAHGSTFDVEFSASGMRILISDGSLHTKGGNEPWIYEERLLSVYDAKTGEITRIDPHKGEILVGKIADTVWDVYAAGCVAFSHDGKRIVSTSRETIKVWDTEGGKEIRTLKGHTDVWSVALSHDSKRIVSAYRDKTVKVWDVDKQVVKHTLKGSTGEVRSVAFSVDGKRIVTSSKDAIKLWDAERGEEVGTLNGQTDSFSRLAFSPNGRRIVGRSPNDKIIKVWDVDRQAVKHALKGHTGPVISVGFSPNSTGIVSASRDGVIKVWDVESGKEIRSLKIDLNLLGAAYSPDGEITIYSYAPTQKELKVSLALFD